MGTVSFHAVTENCSDDVGHIETSQYKQNTLFVPFAHLFGLRNTYV